MKTLTILAFSSLLALSVLSTSTLQIQQAVAQKGPPMNQGQCLKIIEEETCKSEFVYSNQGQCIQFARDHPEIGTSEEACKQHYSPPVTPAR